MSLIFLRHTGHFFLFSFSFSAHPMQQTWWPVLPCTKLAFRGCVKQMTHKSGEKAGSGSFFSELIVTLCTVLFRLDACPERCKCSWWSLSADAGAIVIFEAACEVRVTDCDDDVDDEGFSIVGATASEGHFWSDGKTDEFPVTLDRSTVGSEDNLRKKNVCGNGHDAYRVALFSQEKWLCKCYKAS